jgi:2-polyprenyl-6-methoxyphenol hydroxylase-like FAD-dependent oxidoreductase
MSSDVVVVGGGQAGLAVGFHLARRNINFVILDASPGVGEAWRKRWESLRLLTPARLDGLPGTPFPDRAGALPTNDVMANYLESRAARILRPGRNHGPARAHAASRNQLRGLGACTTSEYWPSQAAAIACEGGWRLWS